SFSLLTHYVVLQTMDRLWMDHIDMVDDLRTGIGLQAYGQRDPLVEFKNQAFHLFERLMSSIDYEVVHQIFKVELVPSLQPSTSLPETEEVKAALPTGSVAAAIEAEALEPSSPSVGLDPAVIANLTTDRRTQLPVSTPPGTDKSKLGRNDPCWCGSGKKYKRC